MCYYYDLYRIYTQFDVSVTTSSLTLFKLIFYEKNEVRWLSLAVKGHSTITVNQPWVTKEDGYTSIVTGTLTHAEVLSSLSYPALGQAEMVQVMCHKRQTYLDTHSL